MVSEIRQSIEILRRDGPVALAKAAQRSLKIRAEKRFRRRLQRIQVPTAVIRAWFGTVRRLDWDRYTDADPWKLVFVDPNDIEYYHWGGPYGWGRVVDGDWDLDRSQFEDHMAYRSVRLRFLDGADWEETPHFQHYAERLEEGKYLRKGFTSRTEIREYFHEIDELYERIQEEGYRSQRELYAENPRRARTENTDAPHPLLNEIAVNIYRDGALAKNESGNHRLAIAKILDIDKVPVLVRTRHARWQQIRDAAREANRREDLDPKVERHHSHPDLQDLREKQT